ncbi:FadR/GntR family transcriptional regulator [Ramlibacter sp. AN1015]|uniref:FadR/GntR family transcriptional regulator n=1 Tax=Ramlibacter sp. AN1015 TaxID=3133428 RepID=UPI0030BA9390
MHAVLPPARRSRSLTADLVEVLGDRIRDGRIPAGAKLPREADLMAEFDVSRTVVREAMSRLQAAGMVETRHGVGTFAVGLGDSASFRIAPQQAGTLRDVIAVLELRIAVETEGAGLAALRRSDEHLQAMAAALGAFEAAVQAGRDAVGPDFQFHLEIARATGNPHFERLMTTLGGTMIPRARLGPDTAAASPHGPGAGQGDYLLRVHAEHRAIQDAIVRADPEAARAAMRMHLSNSRERRRAALAG